MAPVEDLRPFKVKYLRQKKWHTEPHPCRQFPGHFVFHLPSCSLSSFVLHVLCLGIAGASSGGGGGLGGS